MPGLVRFNPLLHGVPFTLVILRLGSWPLSEQQDDPRARRAGGERTDVCKKIKGDHGRRWLRLRHEVIPRLCDSCDREHYKEGTTGRTNERPHRLRCETTPMPLEHSGRGQQTKTPPDSQRDRPTCGFGNTEGPKQ